MPDHGQLARLARCGLDTASESGRALCGHAPSIESHRPGKGKPGAANCRIRTAMWRKGAWTGNAALIGFLPGHAGHVPRTAGRRFTPQSTKLHGRMEGRGAAHRG